MSLSLVARRYARALFELGSEQGTLERLVQDFEDVAKTFRAESELRNALENPLVAHAAKHAVVRELSDAMGLLDATRSALFLLTDRRRMRALTFIARELRMLADAKKGVLRAEVVTAVTLPEAYYVRLAAELERMTGKRVAIDRRQDPTLLAGVVTRLGDRVFDGSLKTRLASLRDALLPTA